MAVLNVRIEDHVRDQLEKLATEEGVNLSEYVRSLVMEAILPVHEREVKHGGEPPQESLRIIDRQVLSLLHRILGRVLPEDANGTEGGLQEQLLRAQVLEAGYTNEYWLETASFRTELSKHDCSRVADILEMFSLITYSIDSIEAEGSVVDEGLRLRLEFMGFDHNDALEGHMADYVDYLVQDGRWVELKPHLERHNNGNSHHRVLDTYLRMLAEHRRIIDRRGLERGRMIRLLSLEELEQIAEASVHPSNRESR